MSTPYGRQYVLLQSLDRFLLPVEGWELLNRVFSQLCNISTWVLFHDTVFLLKITKSNRKSHLQYSRIFKTPPCLFYGLHGKQQTKQASLLRPGGQYTFLSRLSSEFIKSNDILFMISSYTKRHQNIERYKGFYGIFAAEQNGQGEIKICFYCELPIPTNGTHHRHLIQRSATLVSCNANVRANRCSPGCFQDKIYTTRLFPRQNLRNSAISKTKSTQPERKYELLKIMRHSITLSLCLTK
jgi:hypothetical protein